MIYITLVPAYGRDYKSAKAVKVDWDAGKDFMICDVSHPDDGRYINKEDAAKLHNTVLHIRYGKLTKIYAIKLP
jgi:hypothetical protein